MKASNFRNSEKDFQRIITLIQCLLKNIQEIKIVDYGSSWGYGSYQFLNAGMSVQSFEISSGRADFGNKNLGLNIQKDEKLLEPGNHVFFSSHVIEHHPDIFSMNVLAKKLLLNDGFYIAFCPNGSNEFRERDPKAFHHLWGLVHPNYLNDKFFQYVYSENPYFIGSNPYNFEQLQNWDGHSQFVGDLTGVELFVISRPNIKIKN
jgi:hypothetical protein